MKNPVSPIRVLGMKLKREKCALKLFLRINSYTTISLKRSRRELFINMVIERFIFENTQLTLFP